MIALVILQVTLIVASIVVPFLGLTKGIPQKGTTMESTLIYQNLQKSRVPINSILGFIIRTYKEVGFGRLR